jgi:hypothetical protein
MGWLALRHNIEVNPDTLYAYTRLVAWAAAASWYGLLRQPVPYSPYWSVQNCGSVVGQLYLVAIIVMSALRLCTALSSQPPVWHCCNRGVHAASMLKAALPELSSGLFVCVSYVPLQLEN